MSLKSSLLYSFFRISVVMDIVLNKFFVGHPVHLTGRRRVEISDVTVTPREVWGSIHCPISGPQERSLGGRGGTVRSSLWGFLRRPRFVVCFERCPRQDSSWDVKIPLTYPRPVKEDLVTNLRRS